MSCGLVRKAHLTDGQRGHVFVPTLPGTGRDIDDLFATKGKDHE